MTHFYKKFLSMTIATALALSISACGSSTSDRAISGGALGAGVGAVGSSLTGGSAVTGALVGGAVGAGAGALTKEKDVNLGKPLWRR